MPDVREKLVELQRSALEYLSDACSGHDCEECHYNEYGRNCDFVVRAEYLIANGVTVQECAKPLEEWGEDYGDVLWWKFPIEEPPYVGSPLDEKWPAYHTHWTPIVMPQPPKEE